MQLWWQQTNRFFWKEQLSDFLVLYYLIESSFALFIYFHEHGAEFSVNTTAKVIDGTKLWTSYFLPAVVFSVHSTTTGVSGNTGESTRILVVTFITITGSCRLPGTFTLRVPVLPQREGSNPTCQPNQELAVTVKYSTKVIHFYREVQYVDLPQLSGRRH